MTLSSITVAELRFGAEKGHQGERNKRALEVFIHSIGIANFTGQEAHTYASLRITLERSGTPIGPLDTLIAAHALSLGAVLVTNNTREFSRVPSLPLENWIDEQ